MTMTTALDWDFEGRAVTDSKEYSDRAQKIVESLLAKVSDPIDVEVTTKDWTYIGRTKWGTGRTTQDRSYKFAHKTYVRACYIVAYVGDVEVAIELPQRRYGAHGKIRPESMRAGAPVYVDGALYTIDDDKESPAAIAARAALGMK